MPRIQILELPQVEEPSGVYRTPFVVIIDQCDPVTHGLDAGTLAALKKETGATGVYATSNTIDIPANDLTAHSGQGDVQPAPIEPLSAAEWQDRLREYGFPTLPSRF